MRSLWQSLERPCQRSLALLFVAGLLFWSSMASLLPTLSLYARHVGGTDGQVGLVMGAFAIGLLLTRPHLGQMADRRGRKIVLAIGATAAATAPLGYALADSIPALMALRAYHGISIAAFTTGFSAFVVDLSPPRRKGEIVGYMTLTQPVGVALGPAVGSFLLSAAGYLPLFLTASGFGAAALVAIAAIREPQRSVAVSPGPEGELPAAPEGDRDPSPSETPPAAPAPEGEPRSQNGSPNKSADKSAIAAPSFWRVLAGPRLRIPAAVMLAMGIVFGSISTFVPLLIVSADVGLMPGWFYTAAALASFSVRAGVGRRADRYGRGPFITLSLVSYGVAMGLLQGADSAVAFLLAGTVNGLAAGLLIPMMVTLVSDRAHAWERGRVFSLCLLGFDLGIALAGPVLGSVSDRLGYRAIFAIAAGLSWLALVLFLTLSGKTLLSSLRFALGLGPDAYAVEPAGAIRSDAAIAVGRAQEDAERSRPTSPGESPDGSRGEAPPDAESPPVSAAPPDPRPPAANCER